MFGAFDHVGLLVRDLETAIDQAQEALSLAYARPLELPQYSISGVFLGEGRGTLEVFTLGDPELLESRLAGADRRLDHVAFRVEDLDGPAAILRAAGARFCSPDQRESGDDPIELGGTRHLWTLPQTTAGLALQLIEAPAR